MTAPDAPLDVADKRSEAAPRQGTPPAPLGPGPDTFGVYVHFPWCIKKCPYCDFLSIASKPAEIPHQEYANAVLRELDARASDFNGKGVHSIFFGGGTPSLWQSAALSRVLDGILQRFDLRPTEIEITAECNPGSLTRRKADELRALGVNRLSIGVQALNQERLAFLGRWHTVDEGLSAVRSAIESGFAQVSADLIFGVSGQSAAEAAAEAEQLVALGLTHLSAYSLTLEPGTRFYSQHQAGRLPLLAESEVARSFAAVSQAMQTRGLRHYEISNFCRGDAASTHNLGYWRGNDYLGLGCGAWGTRSQPSAQGRAGTRYRNTLVVERYLATERFIGLNEPVAAQAPRSVHTVEGLDAETLACERLMLGLRTDSGVCLTTLERELGIPLRTPARERQVRRLVERGRLRADDTRWWIPQEQWLFADDTIARLI